MLTTLHGVAGSLLTALRTVDCQRTEGHIVHNVEYSHSKYSTEGHIVHNVDVVADDTRLTDDHPRRVIYRDPVTQAGACSKRATSKLLGLHSSST